MGEKDTIVKRPQNAVLVIYNDDQDAIDFLSDLQDREQIHSLQRFADWGNHRNCAFLNNCKLDSLIILVTYKAPFGLNEDPNKLILFISDDLQGLSSYFSQWVDRIDPEKEKRLYKALNDVIALILCQIIFERNKNTQANFLG